MRARAHACGHASAPLARPCPHLRPPTHPPARAQCAEQKYDLDANLSLLRFYQFMPASTNVPILAKVLMKALMQLPSSDYKCCLHLVPERVQVRPAAAAAKPA